MTRRKSLIARVITQSRSDAARTNEPEAAPKPDQQPLDALVARIDRLEAQLEGLQDAVYRETVRQNARMTAITNKGGSGETEHSDPRAAETRLES
jgi:cell division protein FtsB